MIKTKVLLVALPLLISACASRPVAPTQASLTPQADAAERSTAGEVAKGAGKGALAGAGACGAPIWAGSFFGPIGMALGGIVTLYCLPFGVTLGAIAGAARSGS
jgi:ABC-type dipeptide/oligopeptide/nickel transport system permease subunit